MFVLPADTPLTSPPSATENPAFSPDVAPAKTTLLDSAQAERRDVDRAGVPSRAGGRRDQVDDAGISVLSPMLASGAPMMMSPLPSPRMLFPAGDRGTELPPVAVLT